MGSWNSVSCKSEVLEEIWIATAIRQEIERIQTGKEDAKLPIWADDMILQIADP